MAGLALIGFLLFAVADWIAVGQERRRLEYIAKPAALAALLIYAASGPAPSVWLISALALSLLGDVYLMLPQDLFAAGLGAFLLAHAGYIAAFDASVAARVGWLVVVIALAAPVASRILRGISDPILRRAVTVYIFVIALMVASAIASGSWRAAAGALLFFVSDGLIAWNRFVQPLAWARPAIIVTYHLGQLGLVAALRG